MIMLQLPAFPKGQCFGCVFDGRRNSRSSLGLGWPGRGWQGHSSLGVLDGTGSEAEACHSSKIVYLCILCCFSLETNPIEIR